MSVQGNSHSLIMLQVLASRGIWVFGRSVVDKVLEPNGFLNADKGREIFIVCAPGTVFSALLAGLT